MHNLIHVIPDVEALLQLEPEELGAKILMLVRKREGPDHHFHPGNYMNELFNHTPHYPQERRAEVELAVSEAWAWIQAQGLAVAEPGIKGANGWRRLSRRARRIESEAELSGFATARRLPKELIHPRIADKVWMALVRGEFDTAVFQATRAVEVAVREAGNYTDDDLGVDLMRKAFHASQGPLRDPEAQKGEMEALAHLFAGAIGYFKNPHSHREVQIAEPSATIEIIMLASHLLRIVDERRAAAEARRASEA